MTHEAPPEGQLIANAQKRLGLSARKAAMLAGISDSRWRHIVNGYQPVGQGQVIPVRAPADTLARMAHVVGVSPKELAESGRADAAEELHQMFPSDRPNPKDARWVNLARAVEPRIVELGYKSAGQFARANSLNPESVAKVVAGEPVGKPAFYSALERRLEWQHGSVASACQAAPPIRMVGSPGGGNSLENVSSAELLAEIARRLLPEAGSGGSVSAADLDDPAHWDLAAHPHMETEREKYERLHGDRGEENQDTE
ncbi:helix-turn-helix domain-containing protein [Paeniglutamicibacter sp. R2-26]|uniref:helix-turn-helix domain-containing protein n=1 Tax=Paeniglutamicibacter sp. R2-26 TaxID=3144417 RepID=UPI003EE69814